MSKGIGSGLMTLGAVLFAANASYTLFMKQTQGIPIKGNSILNVIEIPENLPKGLEGLIESTENTITETAQAVSNATTDVASNTAKVVKQASQEVGETIQKYFSNIDLAKYSLDKLKKTVFNMYKSLPKYEPKDKKDSDIIKAELQRIRKIKPNFPYSGEVSKGAQKYIDQGLIRTPEELVYISRVIFWESKDDNMTSQNQKKEIAAVTYNMLTRHSIDLKLEKEGKERFFSKKGANLTDLIFQNAKNEYDGITWQYSIMQFRAKEFTGEKPLYGKNGDLITRIEDDTYKIILGCLEGDIPNPAKNSVFYLNPSAIKNGAEKIKKWEKNYGVEEIKLDYKSSHKHFAFKEEK